jgi:RNA polymerase sigma-70 factor (ECF subfamily)
MESSTPPNWDAKRSDAALLARLRAGDPRAFEELVRSQSGRMLAVARRLLRSEEDAMDAVQEAFLNAHRSLDRFQGDSALSTWLHRIVVNAALMKLRSKRRKPEESVEDLLPTFQENGHYTEDPKPWMRRGDVAMEAEQLKQLVREQIDALPENYRLVLMLRDIDELSTTEVAEMLGVTPNAVKVRLHRARQALRSLLDSTLRRDEA